MADSPPPSREEERRILENNDRWMREKDPTYLPVVGGWVRWALTIPHAESILKEEDRVGLVVAEHPSGGYFVVSPTEGWEGADFPKGGLMAVSFPPKDWPQHMPVPKLRRGDRVRLVALLKHLRPWNAALQPGEIGVIHTAAKEATARDGRDMCEVIDPWGCRTWCYPQLLERVEHRGGGRPNKT